MKEPSKRRQIRHCSQGSRCWRRRSPLFEKRHVRNVRVIGFGDHHADMDSHLMDCADYFRRQSGNAPDADILVLAAIGGDRTMQRGIDRPYAKSLLRALMHSPTCGGQLRKSRSRSAKSDRCGHHWDRAASEQAVALHAGQKDSLDRFSEIVFDDLPKAI